MQQTQMILRNKPINNKMVIQNQNGIYSTNEIYSTWATDMYSYMAVYAIFDAAKNGKFELFEYVLLPYVAGTLAYSHAQSAFWGYFSLQLNKLTGMCAVAAALWALWEIQVDQDKKKADNGNSVNTLFLFDSVVFILSLRTFLCAIRAWTSKKTDIGTLLKSVSGNVLVLILFFLTAYSLHSMFEIKVATLVAPYLFVAASLSVVWTVLAIGDRHTFIEVMKAALVGCTIGVISTAIFDVHSPQDIKANLKGFPSHMLKKGQMSNLLYAILRYVPYVLGFCFLLVTYRMDMVCNTMFTVETGTGYLNTALSTIKTVSDTVAAKIPREREENE